MAWRCTGNTNKELVDNLLDAKIISSNRVASAMHAVDRAHFSKHSPYEDSPQYIGYGATISAPHMHGYALESLQEYLQPGMKALDVGSGSGYLTACMAAMVGEHGHVVGIDHIPELVAYSQRALDQHYSAWTQSGRIKVVAGDGRKGYPGDAPYDCIHVGAASSQKPTELISQLKSPGRLFVPVGSVSQNITVYDKDSNGNVKEHQIMGVMYVPLTDPEKQLDS
ncbi:hypothetical protein LPJ78_000052 [Coemansia sp. RSA 989]|nr:protein-L-isoaspartate O-methyltransferase [Coemansia mojavensis]KAJ1744408.1 hypothetical protein LPJ68_000088 [Coemansia sp. RSA 1086]KAJ1753640.1 hypothetical protein LPJ79_000233 [Coemansia sp. RSA 1821]KAJ1868540.1 hypothetical protein LPJ78_000052 [Coemansia sp. RSA 989]KAJ1876150.1 hypothetical protein LPJ55_000052 [Coemansia sp. RSA 990]KAJ2652339.1 hypothetical protein IWW40_001194 [Coemansia sp. RSA 1250]KAJ2675866.1 hypothetical protein IWW42_000911 [Coemansia sp. RSA 1085]